MVLPWLSVLSEVQTCIRPSWYHCHSLSLASVKSRLVFTFLVPAHLCIPGQRAVERLCVYLLGELSWCVCGIPAKKLGCTVNTGVGNVVGKSQCLIWRTVFTRNWKCIYLFKAPALGDGCFYVLCINSCYLLFLLATPMQSQTGTSLISTSRSADVKLKNYEHNHTATPSPPVKRRDVSKLFLLSNLPCCVLCSHEAVMWMCIVMACHVTLCDCRLYLQWK